jgi:hypothetical protein
MPLKFFRLAALGLLVIASSAFADEAPPLSKGETVYAPVYSDVQYGNLDGSGNPSRMPLSAMLSIRNTNPGASITLKSARYYDSAGKELREFIEQPKTLAPLESTEVFVEHRDMAGGSGANFLVVWEAAAPVNPPVIEVVHGYFFGNQSVAFISPGRTIRTTLP